MLKSGYRKYPISPWVNLKTLSYLKGVCEHIHLACQSVRVFLWLTDHRQIHDTHPDASTENSSRQLLTFDTSTSTPTYIRGIWYHRTHANLINRDQFPPQLWPPVNLQLSTLSLNRLMCEQEGERQGCYATVFQFHFSWQVTHSFF